MLLYLHSHFNFPGGGSKWVLETASRLSKKGMNLKVMSQGGKKEIIGPYKNVDFVFFGGPPTNSLKYWLLAPFNIKNIFKEIDRIKPDIIFPQSFPATHWAFLYKKKNPEVKCIWMCHEPTAFVHDKSKMLGLRWDLRYLSFASNPILKQIDIKLVRKYTDKILTNSTYTYKNAERIYNKKSTIVNLGVDVKKYKPLKRKKDIFFTINRITRFKKIDVAIRAMNIIVKKHKDVKFYIGGEGEEKENLIKLTKSLRLEKNVKFLGLVVEKDVPIYHSRAIATLFPSVNEPGGIVPLEAMACGAPVIATKSGGPQDYVINGKTGFLVKPNNPKAIAEKMELLISDPKLVKRMGLTARKHIVKNHSWDVLSGRLYKIFKELS